MAKVLRWTGNVFGALVLLIVVAAAVVWIGSSRELGRQEQIASQPLARPASVDLADVERRARTLGCISCHGEGLTGKPLIDDAKVAKLHSPNLTLIAALATDQQLAQGIRNGVGHDGRALLAMPSEAYQFLSNGETAALVAYIRSLPKKGSPTPARSVGPLGRFAIFMGKFQTTPKLVASYRQRPPIDLGPQHARGRYLAMTTCSGCHGSDLSGRVVSPEIDAPSLDIAAAYDLPAFTRLLREGVAPPGRPINEMKRIAREDSRYYTDQEMAALHAYLVERASRTP